jgi:hypothetical protein
MMQFGPRSYGSRAARACASGRRIPRHPDPLVTGLTGSLLGSA